MVGTFSVFDTADGVMRPKIRSLLVWSKGMNVFTVFISQGLKEDLTLMICCQPVKSGYSQVLHLIKMVVPEMLKGIIIIYYLKKSRY